MTKATATATTTKTTHLVDGANGQVWLTEAQVTAAVEAHNEWRCDDWIDIEDALANATGKNDCRQAAYEWAMAKQPELLKVA